MVGGGAALRDLESRPESHAAMNRVFSALLRLVALALYAAAIHLAYRDIFAISFGYMRYQYTDPGIEWIIVGYLIAAVPCLMLPRSIARPGDLVLWVLFLFVVAPTCQVPIYGSMLDTQSAVTFALFMAVVFAALTFAATRRPSPIVPLPVGASARPLIAVALGFSVVTYVLVVSTFGFDINLMSFLEVYDTRLEYRDQIAPSIPILGYLVSNQGNVLNPLLMTWATMRRRWAMLAVGILGQVLLYSATGYKTLALSIPLCVLVGLILPTVRRVSGTLVLWATAAVSWLSIALRHEIIGLVELVMNRAVIAPAHITAAYVTIYEDAPKALWAHSFLSPFIDDPYGLPPGLWVGRLFFGRDEINANASFIADGFANLGYAGIVIEGAFLALLLVLLNSAARGLPTPLVIGTVAVPAYATANGSPFSAVLSYGVAMAIVMFMLVPRATTADTLPGGVTAAPDTGRQPKRPGRATRSGDSLSLASTFNGRSVRQHDT
jgi:hypothetical protein